MLNKNNFYYENATTGEITDDTWLADFWAEIDRVNVIVWRWSEVCECWLDLTIRES